MIIPIGTEVRIKDHPGVIPRSLAGSRALVIGYEDNPPTTISRHHLEIEGDVMFKYPTLFSWQLEINPHGDRPEALTDELKGDVFKSRMVKLLTVLVDLTQVAEQWARHHHYHSEEIKRAKMLLKNAKTWYPKLFIDC